MSERILIVNPGPVNPHDNILGGLVMNLSELGHEVRVLAPKIESGFEGFLDDHLIITDQPLAGLNQFNPNRIIANQPRNYFLQVAQRAVLQEHIPTTMRWSYIPPQFPASSTLTPFERIVHEGKGLAKAMIFRASLMRYCNANCVNHWAVSDVTKAALTKQGIHEQSIFVHYSDISPVMKAEPDWGSRSSVRTELGYADEERNITVVSRFSPEKGLPHVFRMADELNAQQERTRIRIYGDKETSYGRRFAEQLARYNQGSSHVIIEAVDHKTHPNLKQIYYASDVVFFPSEVDSLGKVTIEALLQGTPVIGMPFCGTNEIETLVGGKGIRLLPLENRRPAFGSIGQLLCELNALSADETAREQIRTHTLRTFNSTPSDLYNKMVSVRG